MEIVTIGNDDFLLRRYPIGHPSYVRDDGSVSSYAYNPSPRDTDGLSVNLEKLTTLKDTVQDSKAFGLLRIQAEKVRAAELDCVHHPVEGNYAHSLITGKITKGKRNRLINNSEIISADKLR